MCLKRWPLKAEDLIAGSVIDHPKVTASDFTGYLRLIDDSGRPTQVATEVNIDRKDMGGRAYTMRTLIFGRTLEMSIGGDIIDVEYASIGVTDAVMASNIAMALRIGISGITRIMNACVLLTSVSPRLAQRIEEAYPLHAKVGYDFLTEWDLQTHKKGLELLAREGIEPGTLDRTLHEIGRLSHAWELAEFEADGLKLGDQYFRKAGRWMGKIDLTPGSPGRARAQRFVARYNGDHGESDRDRK